MFVGSERFLLENLRGGGVGCITATGNVNAAAIDRLFREWSTPAAPRLQDEVNAIRAAVEKLPVIPALNDTCVEAGNTLEFPVYAYDPDSNQVTLTGTGEPFVLQANNAFLIPNPAVGNGHVSTLFSWSTVCLAAMAERVRATPFSVLASWRNASFSALGVSGIHWRRSAVRFLPPAAFFSWYYSLSSLPAPPIIRTATLSPLS